MSLWAQISRGWGRMKKKTTSKSTQQLRHGGTFPQTGRWPTNNQNRHLTTLVNQMIELVLSRLNIAISVWSGGTYDEIHEHFPKMQCWIDLFLHSFKHSTELQVFLGSSVLIEIVTVVELKIQRLPPLPQLQIINLMPKNDGNLMDFLYVFISSVALQLLWISPEMTDSLFNSRTVLYMVVGQCSKCTEAFFMSWFFFPPLEGESLSIS